MVAQTPAQGLLWKEMRQLLPLIVSVIGVGIAVQFFLVVAASLSNQRTSDFWNIAWVLPACFAAGAAAVLVGQEKELRTIDWLSALPSQPSRVIAVKLLVAVAGLLVMWIAAALLIALTGFFGLSPSGGQSFHRARMLTSPMGLGTPEFVFQSVVILASGFYTAWRTESMFAGLVLLVPLACGPFLVFHLFTTLYCWTTGLRIVPAALATTVLFGLMIVWIIGFVWLSIRAARRFLSPRPAIPAANLESERLIDAWRPTVATVPSEPLRLPLSAFLWQPTAHWRFALPLVLVVLLLGALGASLMGINAKDIDESIIQSIGTFAAVIAALTVSWLGVMTFAGDGSATRLRFLADRGVSPAKVWLGRQLVPISLVSIGILAYFCCSWWAIVRSDGYSTVLSAALIAAALWTIHGVSQWVGQNVQLLPGAVVIAPILSGVTIVWANYTILYFDAPLWWLLLCSGIPLVATWMMMSRFMDGRRGVYAVAAGILVVLMMILLPVVPSVIRIVRHPDISAQQREQMLAAAETIVPVNERKLVSFGPYSNPSLDFLSSEERVAEYQATDFNPSLKAVSVAPSGSVLADSRFSQYDYGRIVRAATYARVAFSAAPEQSDHSSYLVRWINTIIQWGTDLRQSHGLADQLAADATEIWLVDTLGDESIRSLDGIDAAAAARLLGDAANRNQSRREAVLVSWQRSLSQDISKGSGVPTLGGAYTAQQGAPIVWRYTYQKSINLVAAALLDLIDAGAGGQPTTEQRQRVADLVKGIEWDSIDSPYSDYFRQHVPLVDLYTEPADHAPYQVGALWFAPWELQASQLAASLTTELAAPAEDQQ